MNCLEHNKQIEGILLGKFKCSDYIVEDKKQDGYFCGALILVFITQATGVYFAFHNRLPDWIDYLPGGFSVFLVAHFMPVLGIPFSAFTGYTVTKLFIWIYKKNAK